MLVKFWGVRGSIPTPLSDRQIQGKIARALYKAAVRQIDLSDPHVIDKFVSDLPLSIRGTVGGNTSCVSVETPHGLVILDAGTGIRELGNSLMRGEFGKGKGEVAIFLTHTHWDHIHGFPFFRPAFVPGNRLTIYHGHPHVQCVIEDQMRTEWFPIQFDSVTADLQFKTINEGEIATVAGLRSEVRRFNILELPMPIGLKMVRLLWY